MFIPRGLRPGASLHSGMDATSVLGKKQKERKLCSCSWKWNNSVRTCNSNGCFHPNFVTVRKCPRPGRFKGTHAPDRPLNPTFASPIWVARALYRERAAATSENWDDCDRWPIIRNVTNTARLHDSALEERSADIQSQNATETKKTPW